MDIEPVSILWDFIKITAIAIIVWKFQKKQEHKILYKRKIRFSSKILLEASGSIDNELNHLSEFVQKCKSDKYTIPPIVKSALVNLYKNLFDLVGTEDYYSAYCFVFKNQIDTRESYGRIKSIGLQLYDVNSFYIDEYLKLRELYNLNCDKFTTNYNLLVETIMSYKNNTDRTSSTNQLTNVFARLSLGLMSSSNGNVSHSSMITKVILPLSDELLKLNTLEIPLPLITAIQKLCEIANNLHGLNSQAIKLVEKATEELTKVSNECKEQISFFREPRIQWAMKE